MKILCPIDFSTVSVDAARYAGAFAENYREYCEIELLHCVYSGIRSNLFASYGDYLALQSEDDLARLKHSILEDHQSLNILLNTLRGDPVELILDHIIKNQVDLVIVGTKGLNAKKTPFFGSLSKALLHKASCPVLAVPQAYVFEPMQNIVLAADGQGIEGCQTLEPLIEILSHFDAVLKLLHVRRKGDQALEIDKSLLSCLEKIDYDYYSNYTEGSINKSINQLCQKVDADLLCMIHHNRDWFSKVFSQSQVALELERISMPLLVLSG